MVDKDLHTLRVYNTVEYVTPWNTGATCLHNIATHPIEPGSVQLNRNNNKKNKNTNSSEMWKINFEYKFLAILYLVMVRRGV